MDKQSKISDPEVIIIHCDEDDSQLVPKKKRKSGRKKKRKVQIDSTDNKRLIITQKIKKQKFQCIINLTNICKHKHKSKARLESFDNEKKKKKREDLRNNSILERVPPRCMRKNCRSTNKSKCCSRQPRKRSSKKVSTNNPESPSHLKENLKHCSRQKTKLSNRILLSPVSFIDLSEEMSSVSYENISSDSLESDNELDTLIKRAKDREKHLTMTIDSSSPPRGSQPPVENSSDEDNIKCIESASIHSVATLVLEPHSNLYSPTLSSSAQNYSPIQIVRSPNKYDSKYKYPSPINMKPELCTSKIKDITSQSYPEQGVGAQRNVNVKKELYCPVAIKNYNEYFAVDKTFHMNTPKVEVLSSVTKSNLLQDIYIYSAGTETNIQKDPYSSNRYLGPFTNADSTSYIYQSSASFQGNA